MKKEKADENEKLPSTLQKVTFVESLLAIIISLISIIAGSMK